MHLLYIDLNNCATQEEGTLTNDVPSIDYRSILKYDNIMSNVPIIRPVTSTTSDPLSQFDSDNTDKEVDNKFTFPLHKGGYKFVDYDSGDKHVSKKCKISNQYYE